MSDLTTDSAVTSGATGDEGPSPDLAILETRIYRGANVWSYDRAIHLVMDLGSLEEWPTDRIPGFTDHLLELLTRRIRVLPGVTTTETFVYLKLNKQHYNWGTR